MTETDLETALPLFAGYQRFYRAEPDDVRNRSFFRRFLEPSDDGLLLGAWSLSAAAPRERRPPRCTLRVPVQRPAVTLPRR